MFLDDILCSANVMLASVAQRTKEIGVRMAGGATSSAFQQQFLAEAVVLSVAGWAIVLSPEAIVIALGSSGSARGSGLCCGRRGSTRSTRFAASKANRQRG